MRLVVGLGNPGKKYADTPHNAGFRVCDRFADRNYFEPAVRKYQGQFRRGRFEGNDVCVLEPETYMNLSGKAVAEAFRYLPIEPEDMIVVYDEIELPAGKLRLRPDGGHAGHNGVRSIIDSIGSRDFPRLRVGVGRPEGRRDPSGHLLSKVKKSERERFEKTIDVAVEALEDMLRTGVAEAMNRWNGRPPVGSDEEEKA